MNSSNKQLRLPAEWEEQAFVQLTWPHPDTDWKYCIEEAYQCFISIAKAITKHQNLLIVCHDIEFIQKQLQNIDQSKITFEQIDSNDTWARDHGGISVYNNIDTVLYDFKFNGWGLKFASNFDNQITRHLAENNFFKNRTYSPQLDFVLEGGSIESNGAGILLTTEECLLSRNRNEHLSKLEIEQKLHSLFGTKKILWLSNGFLEGDDTDSHIDTLARFVDNNSIMYIQCKDKNDVHFKALRAMEEELKFFTNLDGNKFNLIPLPHPSAIFDNGERLPATYANFLFINNTVLVPVYNTSTDDEAIEVFRNTFPDKEIIPIDCSVLIKQHGSLHCVTMQYPKTLSTNI